MRSDANATSSIPASAGTTVSGGKSGNAVPGVKTLDNPRKDGVTKPATARFVTPSNYVQSREARRTLLAILLERAEREGLLKTRR